MEFLQYVSTVVATGGALLLGSVFLFKITFERLLDKKMDVFRQSLQIDTKIRELTVKSQIDFRERQLGEFYGPIYALLQRGKPVYRLWNEGRLSEIDEEISELFFEANNTVVNIILQKSHLISGAEIPRSYTLFLTHVAVWHGYTKTEHEGVPISREEFPEAYYPVEFEENIFAATERLKKELFDLHSKYGLASGR